MKRKHAQGSGFSSYRELTQADTTKSALNRQRPCPITFFPCKGKRVGIISLTSCLWGEGLPSAVSGMVLFLESSGILRQLPAKLVIRVRKWDSQPPHICFLAGYNSCCSFVKNSNDPRGNGNYNIHKGLYTELLTNNELPVPGKVSVELLNCWVAIFQPSNERIPALG